jgi:predicted nucleic acid-binding protein
MRVVIDTNVFVSAALKQTSIPALAIRAVEQQRALLKSAATERQLFEVLARPYRAPLISPVAAA